MDKPPFRLALKQVCPMAPYLDHYFFIYTAQKMKFSIKDSPVNVTKFAVSGGFGHIYSRNFSWKTSFFLQCYINDLSNDLSTNAKFLEMIQPIFHSTKS